MTNEIVRADTSPSVGPQQQPEQEQLQRSDVLSVSGSGDTSRPHVPREYQRYVGQRAVESPVLRRGHQPGVSGHLL